MAAGCRRPSQIAGTVSSFDDVEAEIIDRSGLDERQKAALWLYAWSFVPKRIQRAEAGRLAAYLESGR